MSDKKSPDDPLSPKNDSYASKVFQESSVGIVSSLSLMTSWQRRAFKLLAFFLCLLGFSYQSGQFLAAVFQYPTSVDIEIRRPKNVISRPGYTFCDNNGINRKLFCEKFPDYCEVPSDTFCSKFEYYCGNNKTLVPKKEYYKFINNMTFEEVIELSVNLDEFLVKRDPKQENVTGPYERKIFMGDSIGPSFLCYSLYDRVNSSLSPPEAKYTKLFKEYTDTLSFNVQSDDVFLPGTGSGILFSVHSPFDAVDPFSKGIFMKPGRTYMIFVSMEEELLLEKPYPTNCVNYTEIWEKRGRYGPRTQEMCQQECLSEVTMSCHNCVYPITYYPTKNRLCNQEDMQSINCQPEEADHQVEQCELKCRDDCLRTKYTYTVQERFSPYLAENVTSEDDIFSKILVEVYLEGEEIVVLKHSPKYMFVEVFSNIGGFIGCWLGISLLDITDVFEGFFRIFRHSTNKRHLHKERESNT